MSIGTVLGLLGWLSTGVVVLLWRFSAQAATATIRAGAARARDLDAKIADREERLKASEDLRHEEVGRRGALERHLRVWGKACREDVEDLARAGADVPAARAAVLDRLDRLLQATTTPADGVRGPHPALRAVPATNGTGGKGDS